MTDPETDSDPFARYLSATLELTESGRGERRTFSASPQFSDPIIVLSISAESSDEDDAEVFLNKRQIECLADFLTAWLARLQ